MIIKVCGITRRRDALDSVRYGANALGFNFYPPSPRYLEPERAQALAGELPPDILPVAIAVARPGEDLWMRLPFDVIQLHGIEDPSQIPSTDKRVWIATSPSGAARFPGHEVIIDTSWGTGTLADWTALESLNRPFLLSGGLTPQNLGEALARLDPMGVDVCSGVESSPGLKDRDKLRAFLKVAREHAAKYGGNDQ
jgi:phosphoribosylanthranilate isomerase